MSFGLLALTATLSLPAPSQSADFIGFSKNERLAAWKVAVTQPRDGGAEDLYELYVVVDADSGRALRSYRGSKIERRLTGGRKVRASAMMLTENNPRFAQASSRAEWKRLKRKARFGSKKLGMEDSTFRLNPDADSPVTAEAIDKHITVSGERGRSVGYHGILRRLDGALTDIGHFRTEPREGEQVNATVQVWFSHSGYKVAVANNFTSIDDDGNERLTPQVRVVNLGQAPVGSVYLGTYRSAQEQLKLADRLYKTLHPASTKQFDRFVGTTW